MIEVVAALVRDGERFLVCQRPEGKMCAGRWEFAGGKVEAGESDPEALRREWREELVVEIAVGAQLAEVLYDYPERRVHLTLYAARIASGAPRALEHSALRWVAAEDFDRVSFCPADAELIVQLRRRPELLYTEVSV